MGLLKNIWNKYIWHRINGHHWEISTNDHEMATCECGATTAINVWPTELGDVHNSLISASKYGEQVFSIDDFGNVNISGGTLKMQGIDVLKELKRVKIYNKITIISCVILLIMWLLK